MNFQEEIHALLLKEGGLSRGEICQKLGIAWTTAYCNLKRLLYNGDVIKRREHDGSVGRPEEIWEAIK